MKTTYKLCAVAVFLVVCITLVGCSSRTGVVRFEPYLEYIPQPVEEALVEEVPYVPALPPEQSQPRPTFFPTIQRIDPPTIDPDAPLIPTTIRDITFHISCTEGVAGIMPFGPTFGLDTNDTLWLIGISSFAIDLHAHTHLFFADEGTRDIRLPIKIMEDVAYFHFSDSHRWMRDSNQVIRPPVMPSMVRYITLPDFRLFIITNDGDLWAMGHNPSGILGTGDASIHRNPTFVKSNVSRIYLTRDRILTITDDNVLYGWGSANITSWPGTRQLLNDWAHVRIMENVDSVHIERRLQESERVFAISTCGALYSLSQVRTGHWPRGGGYHTVPNEPTRILDNFTSLYVSHGHFALTSQGELYAWNNSTTIRVLENVVYVHEVPDGGTMAITSDLTLWQNLDIINGEVRPQKVLTSVRSVSAERLPIFAAFNPLNFEIGGLSQEGYQTRYFAITTSGDLYAWGDNGGTLGDGTVEDRVTPVRIMENVKSVQTRHWWTYAITENGDLYGWGNCWTTTPSAFRRDGTFQNEPRLSPVKLMSHVHYVDWTGTAIRYDGTLWSLRREGWVMYDEEHEVNRRFEHIRSGMTLVDEYLPAPGPISLAK